MADTRPSTIYSGVQIQGPLKSLQLKALKGSPAVKLRTLNMDGAVVHTCQLLVTNVSPVLAITIFRLTNSLGAKSLFAKRATNAQGALRLEIGFKNRVALLDIHFFCLHDT